MYIHHSLVGYTKQLINWHIIYMVKMSGKHSRWVRFMMIIILYTGKLPIDRLRPGMRGFYLLYFILINLSIFLRLFRC